MLMKSPKHCPREYRLFWSEQNYSQRHLHGGLLTLLVLTGAFVSQLSFAASNWGSRPAWATRDEGSSESRKKVLSRDTGGPAATPFSPGSHNFAVDVGQVFLFGDLGTQYGDSIGVQGHYTYGVSDLFGLDTSASYSSHEEGKYSLATLKSGLRLNLSWYDKVIPYVVFGLGFYKPSIEVSPMTSLSPVVFGLHAGPGVNLELSKQLFFGASIIFHDIFGSVRPNPDEPKNLAKRINVDGTYTTVFLSVGFSF